MQQMEQAILEKDFDSFAQLTMRDSDDFHELCHTTTPAIHYMNEVSFNIVNLVKQFNQVSTRAAYTFDAGPNAVIYIPKDNIPDFLSAVLQYFPSSTPRES
jgi:diphosphomevalonate decarboxylase